MRHAIALTLLLTCAVCASAKSLEAPHVKVEYDGIDEPQATSIANTLSAAYEVYVDDYKFDMPETVNCTVKTGQSENRLFTDGADQITLLLKSRDQLRPPAQGNPHNLYGMCHEMGHMAMYRLLKDRDWLTSGALEGWAHYAGSVVVDRVYEAKGQTLWFEPYDYREDGAARLDKQLKSANPDDITRGAGEWQKLEKIIGRDGFCRVFSAWQVASIDPFNAIEKAGDVLAATFPSKSSALKSWWTQASPILAKNRQKSDSPTTQAKPDQLTGKPIKLTLDDNTSEGKRSIAGGGHARTFQAPAERDDWYLTAVWIYGQRYGPQRAPGTQFNLSLCESDLKLITQWQRKYSEFPWGNMKWTKFAIPPTRVPKNFSICVDFNPTATSGVYVGYDDSTTGHSVVGTPGEKGSDFDQGDWLIRVELDHP